MGTSRENSSCTPPGSPPIRALDTAVNDIEKEPDRKVAHLLAGASLLAGTWNLVRKLMGKVSEEKQRAGKIIEILPYLPRALWAQYLDLIAECLEEQKQVAELLLGPMYEEKKKERIWNGPMPKALGWPLKAEHTEAAEAVIGKNKRDMISSEEIEDGDVRAKVKVVSEFPNGKTLSGSGTLIGERIILTVGHILFDKKIGKSPAESITVLAGVHGIFGNFQSRKGTYAVLSHPWYDDGEIKQDIGLILLDQPFKTATPIKYRQTPTSEKGEVHGYPSDKPYYGLVPCKSVSVMNYDHDKTAGMVVHEADTFEGSSGGGVMGEDGFLFAIHRGSDKIDGVMVNHAVAIDREGNDIAAFVAVLDYMGKHGRSNGHGVGGVDFIVKEGTGVKVETVKEVEKANGVKGLAFTW